MVLWTFFACLHPVVPPPVAEASPRRETAVWHKAREQYVLAILHFDRGTWYCFCDNRSFKTKS